MFASGSQNNTIKLFNMCTHQEITTLLCHTKSVTSITLFFEKSISFFKTQKKVLNFFGRVSSFDCIFSGSENF